MHYMYMKCTVYEHSENYIIIKYFIMRWKKKNLYHGYTIDIQFNSEHCYFQVMRIFFFVGRMYSIKGRLH